MAKKWRRTADDEVAIAHKKWWQDMRAFFGGANICGEPPLADISVSYCRSPRTLVHLPFGQTDGDGNFRPLYLLRTKDGERQISERTYRKMQSGK